MNQKILEDKFIGCLLGFSVGDALGFPGEGLSHEQIRNKYGFIGGYLQGLDGLVAPGTFTDDTEFMVKVAETILESKGGFNMDIFSDKCREWFKELHVGDRFKCSGPTCRASAKKISQGFPWQKTGRDVPGIGAAMRVAPLGLMFYDDEDRLYQEVKNCSLPTHNNSPAIAGGLAVAYAISEGVKGGNLDYLLEKTSNFIRSEDYEMAERIKKVRNYLDLDLGGSIKRIQNTWQAVYNFVPMAFYCSLKGRSSYFDAVLLAANSARDTDTIAAMTGAIAGARYGFGSIPNNLVEGLENSRKGRDYIIQIAKDLSGLKSNKF